LSQEGKKECADLVTRLVMGAGISNAPMADKDAICAMKSITDDKNKGDNKSFLFFLTSTSHTHTATNK
jgi:hypothetical protein